MEIQELLDDDLTPDQFKRGLRQLQGFCFQNGIDIEIDDVVSGDLVPQLTLKVTLDFKP